MSYLRQGESAERYEYRLAKEYRIHAREKAIEYYNNVDLAAIDKLPCLDN